MNYSFIKNITHVEWHGVFAAITLQYRKEWSISLPASPFACEQTLNIQIQCHHYLLSLICNWLPLLILWVPVSQVKHLSAGWFKTRAQVHTYINHNTHTLPKVHYGWLLTWQFNTHRGNVTPPHYNTVLKQQKNKGTIKLFRPSWKTYSDIMREVIWDQYFTVPTAFTESPVVILY